MEWSLLFFFNNVLLGVGLAMDAFSVSLANGLNEPDMRKNKMCGVAVGCALIIAAVTLVICMASLEIGKKFGTRFSNKSTVLGGGCVE